MGKVGLLHQAALRVQAARRERPVGLRPVSAPRRGGRRADGDPLDVVRHRQPHAGDLRGQQRLPHARLSRGRHVDFLRAGVRGRQPADVRRAARQPLAAHRRREQLVERLSARAASGRGAQHQRPAGPRPAAGVDARRGDAGGPLRRHGRAESPAPGRARRRRRARRPHAQLRAGRPDAARRFPRRPTWRRNRPTRWRCTASTSKESADFARGLPAGPAAGRAGRAVRAALERRGVRHRGPLGRPRQRARQPPPRVRQDRPARRRPARATCGSAACSTTRW